MIADRKITAMHREYGQDTAFRKFFLRFSPYFIVFHIASVLYCKWIFTA